MLITKKDEEILQIKFRHYRFENFWRIFEFFLHHDPKTLQTLKHFTEIFLITQNLQ